MPADETGYFAAAGGVADHRDVLEVEVLEELEQVVGVGVHVVSVPGLAAAAVTTAIVSYDTTAFRREEEDLAVEVVRVERPAVREGDGG